MELGQTKDTRNEHAQIGVVAVAVVVVEAPAAEVSPKQGCPMK